MPDAPMDTSDSGSNAATTGGASAPPPNLHLSEEQAKELEEWMQRHIREAVYASSKPLQEALAAMRQQQGQQHLAPPTTTVHTPDGTPATSEPSRTPSPAPAAPLPINPFRRTKPMKDPPRFTGKRTEYGAWSQQMRRKLELDHHLYGGDPELFYLIYSCLDSKPQGVVAVYYAKGGSNCDSSPWDFLAYLDQCYADTNEQARAAATLRTLRQRDNQTFAAFLPRFEKILAQAGGATWPDSAKITFLDGALNEQLRKSLVAAVLPDEYPGWINRVQGVAGRLEGLDKPRENGGWKSKKNKDHDGDTTMGGMNKLGDKQQRGGSGSGRNQPRAGQDSKKCFRCQQPGHFARDCPASAPTPRAAKVKQPARTEQAASETEDDDDSGSEKE